MSPLMEETRMPELDPQSHKARRLLILGGTGEAVALAEALTALDGIETVTSLAGRTAAPTLPQGAVRIGGFGGVAGLLNYLRAEGIDLVVDATHPFARQITHNAAIACRSAELPLLRLERPAWAPQPDDVWHEVSTLADAAALLPHLGRRVFLTVGASELPPFAGLPGLWFLVRLIDSPARLPLANYEVVLGRGPFSAVDELRLLERYDIDVIVTKNSGGDATYGKIAAARALGLPVILLSRPMPSPVEQPDETVATVEDAVGWIGARLGVP